MKLRYIFFICLFLNISIVKNGTGHSSNKNKNDNPETSNSPNNSKEFIEILTNKDEDNKKVIKIQRNWSEELIVIFSQEEKNYKLLLEKFILETNINNIKEKIRLFPKKKSKPIELQNELEKFKEKLLNFNKINIEKEKFFENINEEKFFAEIKLKRKRTTIGEYKINEKSLSMKSDDGNCVIYFPAE